MFATMSNYGGINPSANQEQTISYVCYGIITKIYKNKKWNMYQS